MRATRPQPSDAPSFAELYTPKLLTVLREGYGLPQLRADAIAGLTVKRGVALWCHLDRRSRGRSDRLQAYDGIRANLGTNPDEVSADAGYCSDANLRTIKRRRI